MFEALAPSNLWTRARLLVAGEHGRGLIGGEYEAWAVAQPRDALLSRFRELVALAEWIAAETDEAHRRCAADALRRAADAVDNGQPVPDACVAAECAILLASAADIRARAAALGVPDGRRDVLNERLATLGRILSATYRNTEPDGLKRLRAEILAAKRATWPASEALRVAREKHRVLRGDPEAEAEPMKAAAALDAAEAAHAQLRRRLWSEWGVS